MGKAPTPRIPEPAPFFPIDIEGTGQQATDADRTAFGLSDLDFRSRFPGLASGRMDMIDSAYRELTGPLDPTVQSSFVNEGLAQSLKAFGGGAGATGVTGKGSIGRKTVASSVAGNVQQKQDYDRANLTNLLVNNQPRAFGLSGSDAANLSIANTGNLNATNQTNYAGQISAQNAREATDAANQQATMATALAILGIIAAFSDKKLKKGIKTVGESESGIPISTFQYKGDKTHYIGAVAQDVEKVIPEAVIDTPKGKMVRYDMIDVPFMPYKPKK